MQRGIIKIQCREMKGRKIGDKAGAQERRGKEKRMKEEERRTGRYEGERERKMEKGKER